MQEITANIHIHTKYSDGQKTHREIAEEAIKAGLDAIIITDHNTYIQGCDGYISKNGKRVLVVLGEEIHDKNRIPQKNHMLIFGITSTHERYANSPQRLIDSINQIKGLSFIAHAYDPEMPSFGQEDLSWEDWSITGYTGLELWNNLSELKIRAKSVLMAVFYAVFPSFLAKEAPIQIREKWDALLLKGKKIVAIGGSDAHTLVYHFGPLKISLFPYSYHFRTINTHILLKTNLKGNFRVDTEMMLSALKNGNAFIANDSIKSPRGFRFFVISNGKLHSMGDELTFRKAMNLTVEIPFDAEVVLIRNGECVLHRQKCSWINYEVQTPGVYRVECYRRHLFERRGWIFSNPIYIR